MSTVKTASWGCTSPFPKTRCLELGSEQQPYRGAGETKAPLELGLWKRTVREREREFSEQGPTPQHPNNQPGLEGGPAKGTQSYSPGPEGTAVLSVQPREGRAAWGQIPHT